MPSSALIWPVPALLAWAAGWGAFALLRGAGAPLPVAVLLPAALLAAGAALMPSGPGLTLMRRGIVGGGFPLSLATSGLLAGALPAWTWLLPLALLLLLYPLRSWRDAPLFPTPAGALRGLAAALPLPAGARIVDAGCGLGDGLRELHREYPNATLQGWEWSRPLAAACAWRCRGWARIARRDIWAADWQAHDLVYLFQRPESMARAVAKAQRELRPGAWLASLEFPATGLRPQAVHACADGRRLWLYRAPFVARD